jgi:hypothetical protein
MYHAVLQYQDEFNGIKGNRKKGKGIQYKGRTNTSLDYISNPVISDFLIMKKFVQDTAKFKLYYEAKVQDISKTLKFDENGEWILKNGYSEIDPSMLGVKGISDSMSKRAVMENAKEQIKALKISDKSSQAKHIMSEARKKANAFTMVIPSDMVSAIESMNTPKDKSAVSKVSSRLTNIWKYTKIRLPSKVLKYNINNAFGDFDAVLIGRPSALLWIPKSIHQLYQYYYKGRVVDAELMHYIERNGLITGQAKVNLQTLQSKTGMEFYESDLSPVETSVKGIKKIWSMATMSTFTDYREQILRYAAYRSVYNELKKSKTGLPKYYAASLRQEIKGISDLRDRSAKMSNDLVGAYDDVSILGKYTADHVIPFFRFVEVNMKRYTRMTWNTFRYDSDLMSSQAAGMMKYIEQGTKYGAFTLLKVAKASIGIGMFVGGLALFNNMFAGDEEDKLPEDVKNVPHLTLPGWVFGDNNLHYMTNLGSLSEFMKFFGADMGTAQDIKEVLTGRMSYEQFIKDAATSPIYELMTGSMPAVQVVLALTLGETYYPDPTKPTQIKDFLEYMADQVGLKDEYKWLSGQPLPDGDFKQQLIQRLFKETVPGDAAVWDTYDLIDQFRALNNLPEQYSSKYDYSSVEGKRHLAAYYYKLSLKLKDTDAAEKYLAEYIFYGGTQKSFNSVMNWWYPTASLSTKQKENFINWVNEDPESKKEYETAMAFIDSLVEEGGQSTRQLPDEK